MKPQDPYERRLKMAEMHDDVLKRIDDAIKKKHSIEACWLCYSCFESRITRTLEKASERCAIRRCYENPKVGIASRIECIKRLRRTNYCGLDCFTADTLGQVLSWCKERNRLVHALVTLNNYYGMDSKFMALAKQGKPLVAKLYDETTAFRNKYYEISTIPAFPIDVTEKCRLCKKHNEEK